MEKTFVVQKINEQMAVPIVAVGRWDAVGRYLRHNVDAEDLNKILVTVWGAECQSIKSFLGSDYAISDQSLEDFIDVIGSEGVNP